MDLRVERVAQPIGSVDATGHRPVTIELREVPVGATDPARARQGIAQRAACARQPPSRGRRCGLCRGMEHQHPGHASASEQVGDRRQMLHRAIVQRQRKLQPRPDGSCVGHAASNVLLPALATWMDVQPDMVESHGGEGTHLGLSQAHAIGRLTQSDLRPGRDVRAQSHHGRVRRRRGHPDPGIEATWHDGECHSAVGTADLHAPLGDTPRLP